MRGTFANIRIKNEMVPGIEGGFTHHFQTDQPEPIFDVAMRYKKEHTPQILIAGKEYGTGSSRDWAAKGVALLGVKAVIAESFERIHRTNLVGMGVLPLQFDPGTTAESLGLDGSELIDIPALADRLGVAGRVEALVHRTDGTITTVPLTIRLDTEEDVEYWRHGGILPLVWRDYVHGNFEEHVSHSARPVQGDAASMQQHELPDAMPASDVPSSAQGVSLS